MPPHIARLAGLGAFGASAGLLAVGALVMYFTRASQFSGLDSTSRAIAWIAIGGTIIALVGVHVMLGRRLLRVASGVSERA